MSRPVKDAGHIVFLILDNLRARHGGKVSTRIEANRDAIEGFSPFPLLRNIIRMSISTLT